MPDSAPFGRTTAAILAWLDAHGSATTEEVATACGLDTGSARGCLVMLGRQGYLSSQPNDNPRARRVYTVTAEGRRRAGIGDREAADA